MTEFCSPSIKNLAEALLRVQGQLKPIIKDANNEYLRSRFATLSNVLEAVRGPLLANSVLLLQRTVDSEPGFVSVQTMLVHAPSGEFISGITSIPLPENADGKVNMGQQTGALISYARRYAITCMLSLSIIDEDNACSVFSAQPQPLQRRFQPPHHTEPPASSQAPAPINATTKANYPGLPHIPDITYEDSKDSDGRSIVIARGKTLEHKESLKRAGFRWNSEKRCWHIAA